MNEQNGELNQGQEEKKGEEQKKPEIRLSVSSDGLEATIEVKTAFQGQTVSYEEIMAFLKENGVVYGVMESLIRDFCENRKFFLDLVCARGLHPVDEENGKLEYLFQREQNTMPTEREDGTVDYKNLGIVQNVKKGDLLCRIIPPQPGKDGIDVYGNAVAYRRGKLPSFPQGKNTAVSEDGLTLTADADGCVEYKNASLSVSEVFIVRGDVDGSSGNIDFIGTVIVQGDVLEGFSVKAGGDINVRGMVEGALLEAGGSIAIACGMNGMSRGKLIAKGSISAQYIENTTVECAGDLRSDVIFNSIVKVGNSVLVRGRKGLLAGGRCQAGRSITANTIGSGGARTEVSIVSGVLDGLLSGKEGESLESVKAELEQEEKNLQTLNAQIGTICLFLTKDPRSLKARKLQKSANSQKELAETRIEYLKTKIAAMGKADQNGLSALDFKITALKVIYTGTKMTIGSFVENLSSDYNATKFYADHEHIVSSPIQPVDRV
ncbi:Flagellar Assembly Protein A [Caprobacter fermentans]|uniref:DUF342 domain-containing protein n=1 Tax=Caproicibacter fermentans TaxID=2576756 RepID=A0A6N8HW24_9FIRM|nr:FapA family protein [Caproicibacter fermentans]MVB09757.1 Flagellar Assembly Protein A [Caproicibacter fermentans]OCN03162.1 hypothetical protein A7X67_13615 [Clostridium sp. W14A]QNK42360.1 DUF342 domain-containing protein [Caproicibacter fermentans]